MKTNKIKEEDLQELTDTIMIYKKGEWRSLRISDIKDIINMKEKEFTKRGNVSPISEIEDIIAEEPDEFDEIITITMTIKTLRHFFQVLKFQKQEINRLNFEYGELKQKINKNGRK